MKDNKKSKKNTTKTTNSKVEKRNFGVRVSPSVLLKFNKAVNLRESQAIKEEEKKPFRSDVFEEMVDLYIEKFSSKL